MSVQDVQLLMKQTNTASEPVASEPEPELKTEPVNPQVAIGLTKDITEPIPSETQPIEMFRTNVADQDQSFTNTQSQIIILDTVKLVNIMSINEKEQIFTQGDDLEIIAMIVEGINNALPTDMDIIEEDEVTHIITIQLDNGDDYQLNYCLTENVGFSESILAGELIQLGDSLIQALQK